MTINGVTLHPDYHSVKDCIPDQDSENDPNYESVDEALSKVPASPGAGNSSGAGAAVMHVRSTTAATVSSPRVTVINHSSSPSPSPRKTHQYEEVSPPTSPRGSPAVQASSRGGGLSSGAASSSSNAASPSGASSSGGAAPKPPSVENAEAAEVRDRVLQGHMYEAIPDVKKRSSAAAAAAAAAASRKSESDKKQSRLIQNMKL